MFAFADMVNLFSDEFASLGGGSFALMCISSGSCYCVLLWHKSIFSLQQQRAWLAFGKWGKSPRLRGCSSAGNRLLFWPDVEDGILSGGGEGFAPADAGDARAGRQHR